MAWTASDGMVRKKNRSSVDVGQRRRVAPPEMVTVRPVRICSVIAMTPDEKLGPRITDGAAVSICGVRGGRGPAGWCRRRGGDAEAPAEDTAAPLISADGQAAPSRAGSDRRRQVAGLRRDDADGDRLADIALPPQAALAPDQGGGEARRHGWPPSSEGAAGTLRSMRSPVARPVSSTRNVLYASDGDMHASVGAR